MKARSRYQGVAQIFAYNRTFYVTALAALVGVLMVSDRLPPLARLSAYLFAAGTAFWTICSLVVSHWVYDRSRLYSLDWLTVDARQWANVHAGLDETTALLKLEYPKAGVRVLDIFDAVEMTEPSIARARALSRSAGEAACWKQLPARAGECLSGGLLILLGTGMPFLTCDCIGGATYRS